MIQQQLHEWIKHPERLNKETLYELRTLLARYPYFQTARLLYLKNLFLLHDISFGEELRKSALYISDRRMLFTLVEGSRYTIKELEKQIPQSEALGVDRTLSLIDAFLSTLPEEPAVPEKLSIVPMDATSDYLTFLMQQPDAEKHEPEQKDEPKLKGQDLIDSFLQKSVEEPVITLNIG